MRTQLSAPVSLIVAIIGLTLVYYIPQQWMDLERRYLTRIRLSKHALSIGALVLSAWGREVLLTRCWPEAETIRFRLRLDCESGHQGVSE